MFAWNFKLERFPRGICQVPTREEKLALIKAGELQDLNVGLHFLKEWKEDSPDPIEIIPPKDIDFRVLEGSATNIGTAFVDPINAGSISWGDSTETTVVGDEESIDHTFEADGTYTVTFTPSDTTSYKSASVDFTATVPVTVEDPPPKVGTKDIQ